MILAGCLQLVFLKVTLAARSPPHGAIAPKWSSRVPSVLSNASPERILTSSQNMCQNCVISPSNSLAFSIKTKLLLHALKCPRFYFLSSPISTKSLLLFILPTQQHWPPTSQVLSHHDLCLHCSFGHVHSSLSLHLLKANSPLRSQLKCRILRRESHHLFGNFLM